MLSHVKKKFISLFACTILFCGCATTGSHTMNSQGKTDRLSKEVAKFMQAMVDKNWEVAYPFFDDGFKKSVSKEAFAFYPRDTEIKAFTVESVEILPSGKEANVTLIEEISTKGFTFKGIKKNQHWLIQNGKWVVLEGPPAPMSSGPSK